MIKSLGAMIRRASSLALALLMVLVFQYVCLEAVLTVTEGAVNSGTESEYLMLIDKAEDASGDGWDYKYATNTLTFSDGYSGQPVMLSGDAIIVVEDDISINVPTSESADVYGIYADNSLTIKGEGELIVKCQSSGSSVSGIYVNDELNIYADITVDNGNAIYPHPIKVSNGNVNIFDGSVAVEYIIASGDIAISGGEVTATYIQAENKVTIKDTAIVTLGMDHKTALDCPSEIYANEVAILGGKVNFNVDITVDDYVKNNVGFDSLETFLEITQYPSKESEKGSPLTEEEKDVIRKENQEMFQEIISQMCANITTEKLTIDESVKASVEGVSFVYNEEKGAYIACDGEGNRPRVITFSKPHNYTWVIDKAATATEEGVIIGTCSSCGDKITKSIPATGENGSGDVSVDTSKENDYSGTITNTEEVKGNISLTDEEIEMIVSGEKLSIILKLEEVQKEADTEEKKEIIKEIGNETLGAFLNIELIKQIGTTQSEITETNGMVEVSFEVSEDLRNIDANITRTYKVIRNHDGVIDILDAEYDEKTYMLSFKTDRFSTYALVYSDIVNEVETPKIPDTSETPGTGDNAYMYVWLVIVVLSLVSVMGLSVKRQDRGI